MSFSHAKDETMYVAVSKDMEENKCLLTWAFNNSAGLKLCVLHVHKFSTKFLDQSRKKDQEVLSVALDEYARVSQKPGVRVEKLYVEAFSIKEGIIQLVQQHCIRKLVMGAAAEKLYSRRMTVKSKKAVFVRDNAPSFCHIWFICHGRLIHTREAINPTKLSPGKTAHVRFGGAGSSTAPGRLSLSRLSIVDNHGSSSRSGSTREVAAGRLSQSSSMFMLGNESEGSGVDHSYAKVLQSDSIEAESSRRVAFGESLRYQIAENKAEMAERLYKEESKQRKTKEEELAKEKAEHNKTSNELHMITAQIFSLENQLEKSNLSLQESEIKLRSAVESLQKYKNEHAGMCQSSSVLQSISDDQAPNYFICPILQEIMEDPHIASDGFTYEAEAIRGWLNSGHYSSPMTNVTLANHNLTPNRALRSAIQEWLHINRTV